MARRRQRVMIIGQPGSGKSTLARALGDKLDLPVVHIDKIHWQPGWIERDNTEKDRLCAEVHARAKWIFEGGHSNTWPERIDRADTLICLDFPLRVRSYRILKRRFEYLGATRPDMPENCPENLNWEFMHFVWTTRKANRTKMLEFFNSVPNSKEKYRLHDRSEVDRFLEQIN